MSQQKSKKTSPWYQCEKCQTYLLNKDVENHENFCPPRLDEVQHTFIHSETLCGILDTKTNEEIENLSSREKDGLVFVSQAAMQLCNFPIGDFVLLASNHQTVVPMVQKVWPTNEKSLTSVLVTKNCLQHSPFSLNDIVTVRKFDDSTSYKASQVSVVLLEGPKLLEITSELNNRLSKSYEGLYLTEGNTVHIMFYGTRLQFEIKAIEKRMDEDICNYVQKLSIGDSRPFYLVDASTKWKIYSNKGSFEEATKKGPTHQIAGLDNETEEIRELLNATLKKPKNSQFVQSNSVLLYGNSGTGKTALAKLLAEESKANVVEINAPDLYSKNSTSPEETIKELFENAIKNAPSVIILDEVDILCPTRSRIADSEKRMVSTVLISLDAIAQNRQLRVFIIATTNKVDNIDVAFRRCGRLDREIEIPTPNPRSRNSILRKLLLGTHNLSDDDFQEISLTTHGFVGADLVSLCSQASLVCGRRTGDKIQLQDFKVALRKVRPSAMREVQIEVPNVKWSDIGGQDKLKLILRQAVEWPLKYADSFVRLGVTPPKGVLMFGPPGCSKTMIAKALATESGLNFLSIKGPELFSKWVGESEKAVREIFRKARQVAPSIVFFDEIDALGGERSAGSATSVQERVLAQLLTELDGVTPLGDVTILAATNRPDKIDKALLRPGRLDRIVYVPLPDDDTRREIFRIKMLKMPTKGVNLEELVTKTKNYSGAEVNAVCHEAAMMALEEDLQSTQVEARHFAKALQLITPRTPNSLLKIYEDYMNVKI
ncbi:ribosome biogenesis protein SPATA5 isoform X2 [Anthonomus grandis grandis]|uniref:ribosome biogenesis protein SPATA5 isoform X2 n=1 Tax=Anthonomus grandis grandis TaxID=2921223 RepID=UPI0021652A9C|nr:ribosome biogenesis protein SPATA5 isoform X2 [Anthonomus grandis grandis]